ncbi:MAG: bestrophin family ion channel [Reichenbachiella sp.]|uniref:bestrophin family protein n=1 Tax=Reichenbachiella sp. TaxID=2184521 RepID=UPI0029662A51|nr:bestrophin family ion channel [Reichenbachiella sp.]MDW3209321.1 bestrophin family ion channel [Reichenbachiella sp.]
MYIKRNYGFWMTFNWSKKPFILGLIYSLLIYGASHLIDFHIYIPWQPISILGIAVAFYLGFKNNSSYDRTWEARKIYGGIVNSSRSFGAAIVAFVKGAKSDEVKKELVYRHVAWLTALRYQLRLSRPWEHKEDRLTSKYAPTVCEAYNKSLDQEMEGFLSPEEIQGLEGKTNMATQIMKNQSQRLQELRDQEYFEDFRHMELHQLIFSFYTDQGKAERIKNFPFPRQYASTALWLTLLFSLFVPLGLLDIAKSANGWIYWICPVLSALIIWVFFLMEKIGDYSENPFEGTYNDVPITSISRGIEIDLREMIEDKSIPAAIQDENGFLL